MYDLSYFEKMLRQNSSSAEAINQRRWAWVTPVLERYSVVLDYGSGVGWFRAFSPSGYTIDTYDIGLFPQTGILHEHYDLITFWDVLEHIPFLTRELGHLISTAEYVAFSVPIPPRGQDVLTWKHYKPGEHIHYLSRELWVDWWAESGFEIVKQGMPECPPREDIVSFLMRRKHDES